MYLSAIERPLFIGIPPRFLFVNFALFGPFVGQHLCYGYAYEAKRYLLAVRTTTAWRLERLLEPTRRKSLGSRAWLSLPVSPTTAAPAAPASYSIRHGTDTSKSSSPCPPPLLGYQHPTRIPGYLRSPCFHASQPEENRMPAYPHPTLPGPDLPPPISPIEWPGTTAVEGGWITKSSLNTPPRPSFDWPTLLNFPNFPSRPPRTSPDQARPDMGTLSLHVRHFFLSLGILNISHLDLDLDFDTLNSPQPRLLPSTVLLFEETERR